MLQVEDLLVDFRSSEEKEAANVCAARAPQETDGGVGT